MQVLYCIGETSEEQPNWQEVLRSQIEIGLDGADRNGAVIAYEPVWAIEIGFDDFQIFVGIKANFSRKPGQCDQSTE